MKQNQNRILLEHYGGNKLYSSDNICQDLKCNLLGTVGFYLFELTNLRKKLISPRRISSSAFPRQRPHCKLWYTIFAAKWSSNCRLEAVVLKRLPHGQLVKFHSTFQQLSSNVRIFRI